MAHMRHLQKSVVWVRSRGVIPFAVKEAALGPLSASKMPLSEGGPPPSLAQSKVMPCAPGDATRGDVASKRPPHGDEAAAASCCSRRAAAAAAPTPADSESRLRREETGKEKENQAKRACHPPGRERREGDRGGARGWRRGREAWLASVQ